MIVSFSRGGDSSYRAKAQVDSVLARVLLISTFALSCLSSAHAAEWTATENTKFYKISGTTPQALYKSIGQKGPTINLGTRTIALTNWDLKWRRNYQPSGNDCILKSALPFVTITYTLPKPSQKLSGQTERKWQAFSDGIKAHEKVHGDLVKELTQNIIKATVGLRTENDKACQKIRKQVLARVKDEFDLYKQKNRAFEQREMSDGGNVHQLILELVN